MSFVRNAYNSTIGMKWVMGLTGAGLFLFVLVHMLGNLQMYLGPDAINTYAEKLQHMGGLLWVARAGLLTLFALHVTSAIRLTLLNRAARPVAYQVVTPQVSAYAARTMMVGGLVLLTFVVYHLAHFTLGLTDPASFTLRDAQGRHDVYAMVVLGFRQPVVALLYIVAMVPLVLHLQHGVSSAFQTLGANHPRYNRIFRAAGPVLGTLIFVGNVSIPLAILAGLIPYPVAGH